MPSVSVITPAYNPGPFLEEAVRSVIAQTYQDWELIVVDDGSTEDLGWVDRVDPRVRRIRQDNSRQAVARNRAIASSSGDLIAFLDADDVWLPHKLQRQIEQLRARPDAVLTHSQARHIDEHSRPGSLGFGGSYETYQQLLDGCGVYPSCVLMRREVLFRCGLFNPLCLNTEDYDLWLRATKYGPMVADPEPLALYRLHSANSSRNYRQVHAGVCEILRSHQRLAREEGRWDIVAGCQRGLRRTHRSAAMQGVDAMFRTLKVKDFRGSTRHLATALRIAPFETMAYVARRLARYLHKNREETTRGEAR